MAHSCFDQIAITNEHLFESPYFSFTLPFRKTEDDGKGKKPELFLVKLSAKQVNSIKAQRHCCQINESSQKQSSTDRYFPKLLPLILKSRFPCALR
jgi:hypothetical protein